jgi:hypothetical protein
MAGIDFPNSPVVDDLFTVGDRVWRWTGVVWETVTTSTAVGPQGPPGGFNTLQTVESKASNYSLLDSDAGKLIINSAAINITVQGIEQGKRVEFLQTATGEITFLPGLGYTINSIGGTGLSSAATSGQGAHVTIYCTEPNVYWLVGDLASN